MLCRICLVTLFARLQKPLDKNVNWSLLENVLQAITPSSWEKVDVQKAEMQRLEMIRNMPLVHKVMALSYLTMNQRHAADNLQPLYRGMTQPMPRMREKCQDDEA